MVYKILLSLIFSVILFSSGAFSEGGNNYDSASITDFTLHKVTPKRDISPVSAVKTKSPQNTVRIKTADKPAVVAVSPAVSQKPVYSVKHAYYVPVYHKPHSYIVTKETASVATAPEEPVKKKNPGFNKENYTEKLNTYLNKGQNAESASEATSKQESTNFDYIIRPSISLGIVLLLILATAWLYNKLQGKNPNFFLAGKFQNMNINKFNVIASSSLGQGKLIHLVEINGKQLVVGSTNNNINLLTEISIEDIEKLKESAKATKTAEEPVSAQADEVPEQEEDELNYMEPDSYSAGYTDLYKEYTDKGK